MDHVRDNRSAWDRWAGWYAQRAPDRWAAEPHWGLWNIPEPEVGMLPADVAGLDVAEFGCGTGYVSAWLARRGARPVGLDNSAAQLATAARMQDRYDLHFPLVHADAECAPFAEASFDMVISEYGASIWCDPYRWIPEAARVLRPGGQLVFLKNSTLLMMCVPDTDGEPAGTTLIRDYFGMHRFDWPQDVEHEFHLGHAEWFWLLRSAGFDVEDLIEPRPPLGATSDYAFVTPDWARRWPTEEIWKARKRGVPSD